MDIRYTVLFIAIYFNLRRDILESRRGKRSNDTLKKSDDIRMGKYFDPLTMIILSG